VSIACAVACVAILAIPMKLSIDRQSFEARYTTTAGAHVLDLIDAGADFRVAWHHHRDGQDYFEFLPHLPLVNSIGRSGAPSIVVDADGVVVDHTRDRDADRAFQGRWRWNASPMNPSHVDAVFRQWRDHRAK